MKSYSYRLTWHHQNTHHNWKTCYELSTNRHQSSTIPFPLMPLPLPRTFEYSRDKVVISRYFWKIKNKLFLCWKCIYVYIFVGNNRVWCVYMYKGVSGKINIKRREKEKKEGEKREQRERESWGLGFLLHSFFFFFFFFFFHFLSKLKLQESKFVHAGKFSSSKISKEV